MSIMLGDLNVQQIEKRLGIEFPKEIREFMEKNHQPNASCIQKGKWHCFDIPFQIVCGDIEVATKIYNSIKDKNSSIKQRFEFFIQE
jgi:cell wall assembly regulator SMI1